MSKIYHHHFAGEKLTTCGVPVVRGHVMTELNHVDCEACREAWHKRRIQQERIQRRIAKGTKPR